MKILTVVLLSLFCLQAYAQQPQLARFIDSFANKNNFHGTIVVEHAGKRLYRGHFRQADIAFNIPNSVSTKYKIASVTKFFTAVLVMQLVEEGKLDLQKHIIDYLPHYKGDGGPKVTVHQLLNHTSGISNPDTISSLQSALKNGAPVYQHPLSSDELIDKHCSGHLVSEPGKEFNYNNADFDILGKIVEKASGRTFEEQLQLRILEPLEMKSSGLALQEKIIPQLAETYFPRSGDGKLTPDLPVYIDNWYASGAMYSSADDLLRFTRALFGGKLLQRPSLEKMFTSGRGEYGYGVWVYENYDINKKMYRIVKRPGSIMGAQCVIFHVLEANTTIVILGNAWTFSTDDMAAKIAEKAVR